MITGLLNQHICVCSCIDKLLIYNYSFLFLRVFVFISEFVSLTENRGEKIEKGHLKRCNPL